MNRSGFTVVELVITITVMVILLTLAVVNVSSTQANARDAERRADTESLAMNLEGFYSNQNMEIFNSGGVYPGTDLFSNLDTFLPDLDKTVARAPGANDSAGISFVAATNNGNSSSISPRPSMDNDIYVYQPLTASGGVCTTTSNTSAGACRKFNIFYYQETTNTVEVITSKHQ